MYLKSINPASGEIVREYEEYHGEEVNTAIEACYSTFLTWKTTAFDQRAHLLLEAARLLRDKKEGLAFNITVEMGKNIKEARAEVEKCALVCEYYAENGGNSFSKRSLIWESPNHLRPFSPLARYWPSCPGIFPCGKFFALQHRL